MQYSGTDLVGLPNAYLAWSLKCLELGQLQHSQADSSRDQLLYW